MALTHARVVAGLLALLVIPAVSGAQGAAVADDSVARVDEIYAQWNSPQSPGCAVAVGTAGGEVVSRAYGMADLEHDVPNSPGTVFEAGSVAKQFTAAAIVLLAQSGRLSLDDDVRKHVPELPDYGTPITIRHLFTHTSGLRDWGTVVEAAGWPRTTRIYAHAHALDVISRQKSLNYTPGDEYSYTNSGYTLLAIIAERVSGQSLSEFSTRHLFEPLGMNHTQWRDDFTRVVKGRATAYTVGPEGSFRMLMPFENVYGNGGLLTTVGDLLRWTENLEHGRVGGPAFIEEMHRQARLNDGREIAYASGLRVGTYRGLHEVSHGGATAGYRAFLTRFPDERVSVAVLCNVTHVNAEALAHQTAGVFLAGAMPAPDPPPTVRPSPDRLTALSGLYRNQRTLDPLRLDAAGGTLRMGGTTELLPVSDTVFARAGSGDRMAFAVDDQGRATGMRLLDADGDAIAFEPVPAVSPSPGELRQYEGRFHSDEADATYTLTVASGVLELRLRPHIVQPLAPAYADAFTTPSGRLVRFIRGPSGTVDEMSFGMGRVRDLRFLRTAP
ncbi:MAG: serine hydrolase domain-containing protein [Vicinamibacterales bacterium]|nr:serine hydrolase domain-containing protein [Vicinamibacterales bacterium]